MTSSHSPRDRSAHSLAGRVAVVLGTRPELVRLAPVLHRLGARGRLVHTGQHWDEELSGRFVDELGLHTAVRLEGIGGRTRAGQIAHALDQLDRLFTEERPSAVIVQGDTNATLAGALAANALGIPLIHVEAGLRSHDRAMPEEHNRVMVDHLADILCAATEVNRDNLVREGVQPGRITLTGNTVVEVVLRELPDADARHDLLRRHGLTAGGYLLATLDRPENTDLPEPLRAVLTELGTLADSGTPVLFPMGPRTAAAVARHGLRRLVAPLRVVPPVGYAEFLGLARHAALLVSDSDGVQEECTVLKRPLLVVRRSTERPEAVDAGFAALVRPGPEVGVLARAWLADLPERLSRLAATPSPYGDGRASARIAELSASLAPV